MRLEVAMKLRQGIEQLGGKAIDLFQMIGKGEDMASVEEASDPCAWICGFGMVSQD